MLFKSKFLFLTYLQHSICLMIWNSPAVCKMDIYFSSSTFRFRLIFTSSLWWQYGHLVVSPSRVVPSSLLLVSIHVPPHSEHHSSSLHLYASWVNICSFAHSFCTSVTADSLPLSPVTRFSSFVLGFMIRTGSFVGHYHSFSFGRFSS